jgi:hypothetical protein
MFSRFFLRQNARILGINLIPEPDSNSKEPTILKFTPIEFPSTLKQIQTPETPIHLVPIRHYNSHQYNQVFEALLKDKDTLSDKIILNIPWARPGSWVGCNSRCEALEEEVIKHYKITRSMVE